MTSTAHADYIFELSDRRTSPRYYYNIPCKVTFRNKFSGLFEDSEGIIINICEHGFAIKCQHQVDFSNIIHISIKLTNTDETNQFSCLVHWNKKNQDFQIYGAQIYEIDELTERKLKNYLSSNFLSSRQLKDRRFNNKISTNFESFRNRNNQNIAYCIDHLNGNSINNKPFVIIPPHIGETKRNNLIASHFLACNSFAVLRFDASNHVGESTGEIKNFLFQNLVNDIIDTLFHIQNTYTPSKIILLGNGTAARAILKAAQTQHIDCICLISPVASFEHDLQVRYKENLISKYKSGNSIGITDLYGFPIDADAFIADLIKNQSYSYNDFLEDFKNLNCNTLVLSNPNLNKELLSHHKKEVQQLNDKTNHFVLYNLAPRLESNSIKQIQAVMKNVVEFLNSKVMNINSTEVIEPNFREVAMQAHFEKEKIRSISSSKQQESESEFWGKYLERFHFAIKLQDYKDYYVKLTNHLGEFKSTDKILDAGAGNGSFGSWLIYYLYEITKQTDLAIHYTAIDFVTQALSIAKQSHAELISSFTHPLAQLSTFQYLKINLNNSLPFIDHSFDKICSPLVLTYLTHPRTTLHELYRILKPGGRMVISSIKPNPDFSIIYRSFLDIASNEQEQQAALKLLNNASDLLEKEREGHYRFFSNKEFRDMTSGLDCEELRIERSLADQANVLYLKKKA